MNAPMISGEGFKCSDFDLAFPSVYPTGVSQAVNDNEIVSSLKCINLNLDNKEYGKVNLFPANLCDFILHILNLVIYFLCFFEMPLTGTSCEAYNGSEVTVESPL